jgi:transcriptional regulator with XRE-family HTH domain
MISNTQTIDIGESLRKLREGRNLSIRSLSELCGLAVNTLSLIENGKTSPSVNTLTKIAKALEIPITAFFDSDTEKSDIGFTEKNAAHSFEFNHGKYIDLGSQKTSHPIGPYLINILPMSNMDIKFISHPGYEFALCLNGSIEYLINEKSYRLESGDSILFDATLPHYWHNPSESPTHFLLVLYPIKSTKSTLLHHISEI